MILPFLVAAAKATAAFLASKTLLATAVKFAIGVALLRYFSDDDDDIDRGRNKTNVRAAVSPARYIYGEAKTGGVIVYTLEDDRDFWVVYAVSKGACDSITGIYVDGEKHGVQREQDGSLLATAGKYRRQIRMWEEFTADGSTTGAGATALRAVTGSEWTTSHKGVGVSYVVVKMTQTERDNEGVFSGFPELLFVVKGRKFTWPGQSTPAWTENAAAVAYDYLRSRRGIPAADIDDASFSAAFTICEAQVAVSRPDSRYSEWPATERRYAINGVVFADDDPDRMQKEIEFATRGHIFEWNGKFRITVGANRTPTTTIGDADILEVLSITTAPPISDRVNVATMELDQSRHHDYQNYSAPEVVDQEQLTRDGERLEKNLGRRVLINSPAALDRLLVGNLRRARASMSVTLRLSPGLLMKWLTLKPTELCSITESVHGLASWTGEVSSVTLNDDFSVTAVFDEVAPGEFDDDLGLGALPGRSVAAPRVNDVPAQIATGDITAVARPRAGGGGTILWKVTVTVPASFLGFLAALEVGDVTLTDYTTGNTLEFDIDAYRENMQISVWRTSKRGLAGPTNTVSITPEYTALAIPRAALAVSWTLAGADLLITLRDPATAIVKGAEFRYTFEPFLNADDTPNTAIPGVTLTAATWSAASLLDAQTLLFKPDSDALFSVRFTRSGKYRIHARFVDAVGRYGPVGDLGYTTVAVPENATHSVGGAPSWPGTLHNMHRFDFGDDTPLLSIPAGAPSTVTADEWDGNTGASFWPFGAVEREDQAFDASGSTYYETNTLDLGQNKSGYMEVDFEVYTPEAAAGASGASDDGEADHDRAHRYAPAFYGTSMENQTWQSHSNIVPVITPAADVEHGFLTYSVEGLPNGVEFGGGRLTGAPTTGPGVSGVARITATAENGAQAHEYFAWRVVSTASLRAGEGTRDDPHVFDTAGSIDIRNYLRDGVTNGTDDDIPTWVQVSIPANSVLEFSVTSPPGEDYDMIHNGVHYNSAAAREPITLANPTGRAIREKVAVYRYAPFNDADVINRSSEGDVSITPVRVALAPPQSDGSHLFDEWMEQERGAAGQAVTGEFVAELAMFHAPSVAAGETPTFTEVAITPGQQVAVSSSRYFKGRIHVKKARNRALKNVTFSVREV